MRKITVYHEMIPGNGQRTVFEGPNVSSNINENGVLTISNWVNTSSIGNAAFAAGRWTYIICSMEKEK